MTTTLIVAPFESCTRCFRGDTTTGFWLDGEAEWVIVAIHRLAGIPLDQVEAMIALCEQELGMGEVPARRIQQGVRLCRDCAGELGTEVGELSSEGIVLGYTQPD